MFSHPHQIFTTGILLLVFSITAGLPARGQVPVRRNGQDRRVGGIILPTPPFNPDAGILNSPKTRRGTSSSATPRRQSKRSVKAGKRNPRPGTPRKRRVRRGQQRR